METEPGGVRTYVRFKYGDADGEVLYEYHVLSIFSPNILQVLVDPLYGPPSHVPVALVGTLSVVVDKPLVKVLLQGFHRLVKLLSKGLAEELVQHCSVEPLHEPVRLRVPHLRGPVPNIV